MMRQGWASLGGLLALLLAGCATGRPANHGSWLEHLYPFRGPAGTDVVQMDVALIERPIGDPFINQELWLVADEQAIPFDQKAILEENGFRVGQIGGTTPAGLQTLLTSEKTCVARRLFIRVDKPAPLALGPLLSLCDFQLRQSGGPMPVRLERANCSLEVVPHLQQDGTIHLKLTPQISHGETQLAPGVADDRSGWALKEQKPTETYPALGFEVTLKPNQYLVIGARFDQSDSLGYQCFIRRGEAAPVQRLLVIRGASAGSSPAARTVDPETENVSSSRSVPLASQAAFSPRDSGTPPIVVAAGRK
jgi:hypothetical protein